MSPIKAARYAVTAALPLTLLAGAAQVAPAAASPAAASPAAQITLNADTGQFTNATKGGSALAGVRTLSTLDGAASTSRILSVPGVGPVLADATLADSPEKNARAGWAATTDFADLSWPDLGGTYTIYKDDRPIATTSTNSFRDVHVTPGSEPFYRITADGDKGGAWGLNTTIPAAQDPASVAATAKSIEVKAKKYTHTKITWRSFIRQTWAYVPSWAKRISGCKYAGGYKYAGDSRGFSKKVSGPTYRAGLFADVSWKHKDVTHKAKTGKTRVYKKSNSRLVDTRKASTKKIKFKTMTKFNGKTRSVRFSVEAKDPFCKRGGIGVNANLRLSRSGSYYAEGNYKRAPDHELYIYGYKGRKHSSRAVHKSKMGDIKCLFKAACETSRIGSNGGY